MNRKEIIEKIIKIRDVEYKDMTLALQRHDELHYHRHLHTWHVLDDLIYDIANNNK